MSSENDKTMRPGIPADMLINSDEEVMKTLRPDSGNKTLRPDSLSDKTLRPDGQADKTLRPDGHPSKTLRPDGGTLRPQNQQDEINRIVQQDETEFTLGKGVKYTVVRVISKSTGEADIFLVESAGKQFVLKLYFMGYKQDHDILEIIRKSAGSGLLVDTLEHGVWAHPQTQQQRDYELMVYCEGGSLDQLRISHDSAGEKLLGEIALKCACSLDFLHKKQIIHGDVKPANFFFRYPEQKIDELLLADFGIAKQCDKDGVVAIPYQERTKIYAAPEYYDFIQGEIQISTKTDFFALGMTLLTLWCGENTFSKMNEFQLKDHKKHGTLSYPDDMSDRMLQLMKALTHPNPNLRASFAEIVRWANNEDIYDLKSEKNDVRQFKILFNSAKNQTANSPEELARFMIEDKVLSMKYLYSGKIAAWLADNLRPELVQEIEDITENQYPKDKEAGLYASCYLLDSGMPYYDVQNKAAGSSEEIAQSLLNNFSYYQQALTNRNDSLFIFLNVRGAANVTQKFAPLFKKGSDNRDTLLQLIYTLDPALPWIITSDKGEKVMCHTPEQVLVAKYDYGFSDESWSDLITEAFLVWLRHIDPAVEGRIRSQKGYQQRQTVVLYNLSPKVAYNFQMDEGADDYFFTAEEVGNYMNYWMQEYLKDKENESALYHLGMLTDIDDTRLYDYFKSKGGVYDDKIAWIKYCSDLKSKDNVNKAGPYNLIIGVFKSIKGLGYSPYYYFPQSDRKVFDLGELSRISSKEQKEELQSGFLQDWLTLFYQENPDIDLSKKYTYEREMVKYLEHIKKIDAENIDVVNYYIGHNSVRKTLRYLKRKRNMFIGSKVLIGLLTLLASVAVIYGLLAMKIPIDPQDHVGWITIVAGGVGVLGVIGMFLGSEDSGCLTNLIVGAIIGAVFYAILYFGIAYIGYIVAGVLVLTLILWLIKSYFKYPLVDKAAKVKGVNHKKLFKPTFEELHLEPLHFAYSNDQTFKSSIRDQSYGYAGYLSIGTKKFYKQLILPWILILGAGTATVLFSPDFNILKRQLLTQKSRYEIFTGDWTGTFDNAHASFHISEANSEAVHATIHVKYRKPLQETLTGTIDLGTKAVQFDDDFPLNGTLDGGYKGTFNDDFTSFSGEYQNYKTKKIVKFSFTKQAKAKEKNVEGQPQKGDAVVKKEEKSAPEKTSKEKLNLPVEKPEARTIVSKTGQSESGGEAGQSQVVATTPQTTESAAQESTSGSQPVNDAISWYNQGVGYGNEKNYAEAIRCYEQAVALNPSMLNAWNNMGNAYQSQGNYTEAIRCFDKVLKINPKRATTQINKGIAYHSLKKYKEAVQCYKEAVALEKDNGLAWYNMGVSYGELKNHSEALKCYKQAAQLGNQTAQTLLKSHGHTW